MASQSFHLLLLSLSLLAAGATARPGSHFHPCKTLFISYTFTSSQSFDLPQISDLHNNPSSSSSGGYFAVYRFFRPVSDSKGFALPMRTRSGEMVRGENAFGMSSLHERAKDVLVVVAGLLFGVGCGALTGATMYLAWSVFANRAEICRYGDGEEDEEDEKVKMMGYVKIAEPVVGKEGYEGA